MEEEWHIEINCPGNRRREDRVTQTLVLGEGTSSFWLTVEKRVDQGLISGGFVGSGEGDLVGNQTQQHPSQQCGGSRKPNHGFRTLSCQLNTHCVTGTLAVLLLTVSGFW